jgi:hypothetical protein
MKPIVLATLILALTCCAVPYRDRSAFGYGVSASRIDGETFRIEAVGNALNTRAGLQDFVLRKAAEVTLETNNDFFQLVSSVSYDEKRDAPSGRRAIAIVKVYSGPKPSNAPANVFDARDVLVYIGKPP